MTEESILTLKNKVGKFHDSLIYLFFYDKLVSMKNKNLHINYSFNEFITGQKVWKPSESSFNDYRYDSLEICSLEKKTEHSNAISQEVKTVVTSQKKFGTHLI